jgi:hypothetical protein
MYAASRTMPIKCCGKIHDIYLFISSGSGDSGQSALPSACRRVRSQRRMVLDRIACRVQPADGRIAAIAPVSTEGGQSVLTVGDKPSTWICNRYGVRTKPQSGGRLRVLVFGRATAMRPAKRSVATSSCRVARSQFKTEQLPCQIQGGLVQTALSAVTRRPGSRLSSSFLRRVTPDRVISLGAANQVN